MRQRVKNKHIIHEKGGKTALNYIWPDGVRSRWRYPDDETANDVLIKILNAVRFGDWPTYRQELETRRRKSVSEAARGNGDLWIPELTEIYYTDWCVPRHEAPSFYRSHLNDIARILKDRRLKTFTRQDANYFYNTRRSERTKKGTLITVCTARHALTVLSGMFTYALEERGWIDKHPMLNFDWGEKPKKKKRFPLEGAQVRALVREAMAIDDVTGRLIGIMSETALRAGEAMNIKRLLWDARNEVLILEPSKDHPDGRQIPLSPWALELAAGLIPVISSEYLFTRPATGNKVCRSTLVDRVFEQARVRAGIPFKCRPHDLRHFRAITWLENGADPDKVRVWMGHKSLATTQIYLDYVTHRATAAFKETTRREAEKLDADRRETGDQPPDEKAN